MAARKRAAGQQLESMFEEGEAAQEGSAAAAIEDEVAAAERQYTAELQAELRAARAEAAEAEAAADDAAATAPDQVHRMSHTPAHLGLRVERFIISAFGAFCTFCAVT